MGAETVNSGSAEPDQVSTCEGNKSKHHQYDACIVSVTPSGLRTSNFHHLQENCYVCCKNFSS